VKVALVTGAGSGIGRAVARALGADGWELALAGRRAEALRETAPDALAVPTDVGRPESVDALFAAIDERYGRLDLLFNNAGIGGPVAPIDEVDPADWQATVDTNLTGAFLCARAAFARFKRQDPRGGRIVNNGSISAHVPRPQQVAYTATKHAITGLTRALSLEGRAHGIAVGQIDVGNAATELTERMGQGVLQASGEVAAEPRMDADHVARAVVYMAGLPLDANVQFMTVMATGMPYIGRG
jgi:NAD(P)-dependent dehydrogenase (short-subunit alcohol dehydrogenase family)